MNNFESLRLVAQREEIIRTADDIAQDFTQIIAQSERLEWRVISLKKDNLTKLLRAWITVTRRFNFEKKQHVVLSLVGVELLPDWEERRRLLEPTAAYCLKMYNVTL